MSRARRMTDDDPEYQAHREAHADTPLFAGAAWPESPAVTDAEQRGLALPASLEARYATWRATAEGEAAFQWIAREALGEVARGATRLFVDRLAWRYREVTKDSLNNSHRALLARELSERFPDLRRCFEFRKLAS